MNRLDMVIMNFHKTMNWLQFERGYDECKFLIVDQQVHGFGGQLSRRMLGLQLGYIFGRTVVFCGPNDPPYETCYEPTGKYKIDDIKQLPSEVLDFPSTQQDKVLYFDFDSFWKDERLKSWFYAWTPPEFLELGYNRLFFDGQILIRFKLIEEYKKHIEDVKESICFKKPIIGLHIRRGDKRVEAPYVPLKVSLAQVKKISDETGIRRVFVTSDSDETFNELPSNLGLDYIYDKEEKRYNNANHSFVQNNPRLAKQETQTATKILELLASSDWIVGQNNVHFILLAAALNEARTLNLNRVSMVDGNYLGSYSNVPLYDWPLVFFEKQRNLVNQLLRISRPMRSKLGLALSQRK